MKQIFGYDLPKFMRKEFGDLVKKECEVLGRELCPKELLDIFNKSYIDIPQKYKLLAYKINEGLNSNNDVVIFTGEILIDDVKVNNVIGSGNGPVDAFFDAIKDIGIKNFRLVSYNEHSITSGSDSKAIAYIELEDLNRKHIFGVGIENNINLASINGVLCAINRALIK